MIIEILDKVGSKLFYKCDNPLCNDERYFPNGTYLDWHHRDKGILNCLCNKNYRLSAEQKLIWLNDNYPKYYDFKIDGNVVTYKCKMCDKDEYHSFSNNIFKNYWNILYRRGIQSCRCNDKYPWTKEQREYQINKVLNGKFICWVGKYTNSKSCFQWICNEGHLNNSTPDNTLNNSRGCKICNSSANGFYKNRPEESDFLYLLEICNETTKEHFLKIGRAFNIKERINKLNKNGYNIKVLTFSKGRHLDIYIKEQAILDKFREYKYKPVITFTGYSECLNLDLLDQLIKEFSANS